MAHTFNPRIWEAEAGRSLNLRPLYVSYRTAKATQRNPVLKTNKQKQKIKTKNILLLRLGMKVYTYNSTFNRLRQESFKSEVSLCYKARPCLKKAGDVVELLA